MDAPALPAAQPAGAAPPRRYRLALAAGWLLFWMLLAAVAVQDHWRSGWGDTWRPLLWEGSSCVVATLMALVHLRTLRHSDRWLARPLRWFAANLAPLPLIAPLFVAIVFAIRHAVHAAVGVPYLHGPWGATLLYESLKFALFYTLFVAVMFGLRSHRAMTEQQLRAERAIALQRHAQLLQLAQQIEPHFLFNALNTIAATVHSDPDRADALLVRLAALLRAAADLARRPFAPLADELVLIEGYAAIMQERFAGRVALRIEVDDAARRCIVPALAVQPLLENAFRHGVEREAGPVEVVLAARRVDAGGAARLQVEVACSAGHVVAPLAEGTGLSNLRQRLHAAHGAAAILALEPGPLGRGSRAWFELPCGC